MYNKDGVWNTTVFSTNGEGTSHERKIQSLVYPWKIGKVEIKNRIVQVSMGGTGNGLRNDAFSPSGRAVP